jgi:hypothetical protein
MKPGVVFPNPLSPTLAQIGEIKAAGALGVVARPEAFVDGAFNLSAAPEAIAAAFEGLKLVAIMASTPLQTNGDATAGAAHLTSCIDLADALRDYFAVESMPIVAVDAGPYASGQKAAALTAAVDAVKGAVSYAEGRQVIIGLRPDRGTAVDRARAAGTFLADVGSAYVQIALDAAGTVGDKDTLDDAVGRLKDNIILAFARDVKFAPDGTAAYQPPGNGVLNYASYVDLLSGAAGCGYLVVGALASPEQTKVALAKVKGFVRA